VSSVLAIEPDARQAAVLRRVVRDRARAEISVVDSKDAAIATIAKHVPDLILVTALLSPRDEEDLVAHLRTLDEADYLQTITIPLLATAGHLDDADGAGGGFFKKAFKKRKKAEAATGCDPWAFADQVCGYLKTAAEAKAARLAERAYRQEISGATGFGDVAAQVASRRAIEPPAIEPPGIASTPVAHHVQEPHGQAPEPVDGNTPEQVFNDPAYAFSWRSSSKTKGKSAVKGQKSEARGQRPGAGEEDKRRAEEGAREEERLRAETQARDDEQCRAEERLRAEAHAREEAERQRAEAKAREDEERRRAEERQRAEAKAHEDEERRRAEERLRAEARHREEERLHEQERLRAEAEAREEELARKEAKRQERKARSSKKVVALRPLKRLPPLAVWARVDEPVVESGTVPGTPHEDDEVVALMASLRVPSHVLPVSYPRRPCIHRVRTAA